MADYLFTSARLGFRRWEDADLPFFTALNADPLVMRHFPAVLSADESWIFLHRLQERMEQHGYTYYAADLLETGACTGFIGLAYQEYAADFTPCTDVGWRLTPAAWGQGLATEGAKACLAQAFGPLQLKEVVATAPAVNLPSISVMQRAGMQYSCNFIHPRLEQHERLRDCVLYRMTQEPEAAKDV